MRDLLEPATPDDYRFFAGLLTSPVSRSDDAALRRAVDAYLDAHAAGLPGAPALRRSADAEIERALRYFGSSDVLHAARAAAGAQAGVSLGQITADVARHVDVRVPSGLRLDERIRFLAQTHAERTFARMTPDEQQRALEELGVEADRARTFLTQSAGVFALPVLVTAFDVVVVQGLIRGVILSTVARYVGRRAAGALFGALAARLPWWLRVAGPASWAFSLGWTAVSLQGPAYRKTVPAVLYLGLIGLRARGVEGLPPVGGTA